MLDWQQIASLSTVSAVVTAGSNFLSNWYFDLRNRKRHGRIEGLRIATELEAFAYHAASLISQEATWYASGGAAGTQLVGLPSVALSESPDWKFLETRLVQDALQLREDIKRANIIMEGEFDHLTPDEAPEQPALQAGLMGYRAHQLARRFRRAYADSPSVNSVHPWDYTLVLKKYHDLAQANYVRVE